MYGLRAINNHYSEFAGQRGDYLIIKNSDFEQGKIGSKPRPDASRWDNTPLPCHPRRSPVADLVRKAGSAALIRRLTQDFPPPPRERALARSASMASRPKYVGEDHSSYHHDLEKFMTALSSPELLPKFQASDRQKNGVHCNLKDVGANKHYESMHEEFANLAERLKRDPQGTRQFLENTGSWKHWGLQLEHAYKRDKLFKQSQREAKSSSLYALDA